MRQLTKYLGPYRVPLFLGPAFKLIEAVFELFVPLVMASIIDRGVRDGDTAYIYKMGGVLVLLAAVGLCSTLVCQKCASVASQGSATLLRDDLFDKIMNALPADKYDSFGANTLIARVGADTKQLEVAVAMLIRLVVRAPFLVVGSTVMAFSVDPVIALIFAAATVLIAAVVFAVMKLSVPVYSALAGKSDRLQTLVRSVLSGSRPIRAFRAEGRERDRFAAENHAYTEAAVRVGRVSSLIAPSTYALLYTAVAVLLYCGASRVDTGALTQGEVVALINYLLNMLTALLVVANLFVVFTKSAASAKRVCAVLDASGADVSGNIETDKVMAAYGVTDDGCAVKIEGVSFSYGGVNALEDVSFTVREGERVGVIGATGSGKSTLAALIMGYRKPSRGTVTVFGGAPGIDPSATGFVPQRAVLFKGTVASNLRLGCPDATDDMLLAALKTAQAYDFVSEKTDGVNAIVAQGGSNFSGGQRQRLCIARALVGKKRLLIFDDSSSALDFATEHALRDALTSDMAGVSQIVIAQRVSSVRSCSRIYVMDDGKIAAVGTHDGLAATCAEYREICASQGLPYVPQASDCVSQGINVASQASDCASQASDCASQASDCASQGIDV